MVQDKETAEFIALRKKAMLVYDRLLAWFGMPEWRVLPPLDELVNTILSQNTNDRNRDLAFERLQARYPSWEALRDAPEADVIDCVRPAGLGNQKGQRIQTMLKRITEEHGTLNLDFLSQMAPEEIRTWLTSFHGVGMKTASIVMVFSLGIPAFPVDTHVHRVTGRLGLRPAKMNADQTHLLMESLFPAEIHGPAHINIILFGRRICHARKPECEKCVLNDICDEYQKTWKDRKKNATS